LIKVAKRIVKKPKRALKIVEIKFRDVQYMIEKILVNYGNE